MPNSPEKISRGGFLRVLGVGAVVAFVGPGCSTEGESGNDQSGVDKILATDTPEKEYIGSFFSQVINGEFPDTDSAIANAYKESLMAKEGLSSKEADSVKEYFGQRVPGLNIVVFDRNSKTIRIFNDFSAYDMRGRRNDYPTNGSVEISIAADVNEKYEGGRSLKEKVQEMYGCGYSVTTVDVRNEEVSEDKWEKVIYVDSSPKVYKKYNLPTPTPSPKK